MPEAKLGSQYSAILSCPFHSLQSYFILPVYYQLYVADGPLESVNAIYSNDHFISCILSKSVAPPHTTASLKKYVCQIKSIEAPEKCSLFLLLVEKVPIGDDTHLSLQQNLALVCLNLSRWL